MVFGLGKNKLPRYLVCHPGVRTILIAGSYGRKSAIRSLGMILGQQFTVSFGLNPEVNPQIILLDYESFAEFPEIVPDITVVTSCINQEEAQKYIAIANKSRVAIANRSDIHPSVLPMLTNPNLITYGDELPADYYFENTGQDTEGQSGNIVNLDGERIPTKIKILGEHNIRPILMACAVARQFNMPREKILQGVESITPLHGRMSPAHGISGSIVIDDSADGTPTSVYYGLRAIYSMDSPSRVIITDNPAKLQNLNIDMLAEVLILGSPDPQFANPKYKYFDDRLVLMNHLGQLVEPGMIILLEIPFAEIIERYMW